jgi:hypothetical protein
LQIAVADLAEDWQILGVKEIVVELDDVLDDDHRQCPDRRQIYCVTTHSVGFLFAGKNILLPEEGKFAGVSDPASRTTSMEVAKRKCPNSCS